MSPRPRNTDPTAAAIEQLARGELADPHRVLGAHDGTVRALRPGAAAMRVLLPDGEAVEMTPVEATGVFTAEIPAEAAAAYRLEARYDGGPPHGYDDPYRFGPTP